MPSFSQHRLNTCCSPGFGPGLRHTKAEQVLTSQGTQRGRVLALVTFIKPLAGLFKVIALCVLSPKYPSVPIWPPRLSAKQMPQLSYDKNNRRTETLRAYRTSAPEPVAALEAEPMHGFWGSL